MWCGWGKARCVSLCLGLLSMLEHCASPAGMLWGQDGLWALTAAKQEQR